MCSCKQTSERVFDEGEQGGEAAVGWLCERHHGKDMEGQKETRRLIDTLMTLYMTSRVCGRD